MAKKNRGRKPAQNLLESQKNQERKRNIITAGVVGLAVALILGAAVYTTLKKTDVEKEGDLVVPTAATELYGLVHEPEEKPKEALPEVVVYADYSCSHCKTFEDTYGEGLRALVEDNRATVEYRPVGFLDAQGTVDQYSKRAGAASMCVREEGTMDDWLSYNTWLFENQPPAGQAGRTNGQFVNAMEALGLPHDPACVRSERYLRWMIDATRQATEDGVSGTPSVRVNGEEVNADIASITAAVEAA